MSENKKEAPVRQPRSGKAWVTKWCLTKGIMEIEDFEIFEEKYVTKKTPYHHIFVAIGTDVFFTEKEAIANYKLKITRKIESCKKSIKTLEKKLAAL
jgi:hypothetical protein